MRMAKGMALLMASWLGPYSTGLLMARSMAFQMTSWFNPEMGLEAVSKTG